MFTSLHASSTVNIIDDINVSIRFNYPFPENSICEIFPVPALAGPALFDQLCAPVILLELIVQPSQLFGHFVDLILPVRYEMAALILISVFLAR